MTLRKAKQIIRQWIQTHFDDQRLAAVYAFNADGRMRWGSSCSCLLGVTLSEGTLHQKYCSVAHYDRACLLRGADEAEIAYLFLEAYEPGNDGCRRRLSAILGAELRRRDRERSNAQQALEQQTVPV